MMRKGFTLVELLIVIIIIGILATMAVPQYNKMVDRAKRAEAQMILSSLGTGSIMYYAQSGGIITGVTTNNLDVTIPTGGKWVYDKSAHTATNYVWLVKGNNTGVLSSQRAVIYVTMPGGKKAMYYTTDNKVPTTTSSPM